VTFVLARPAVAAATFAVLALGACTERSKAPSPGAGGATGGSSGGSTGGASATGGTGGSLGGSGGSTGGGGGTGGALGGSGGSTGGSGGATGGVAGSTGGASGGGVTGGASGSAGTTALGGTGGATGGSAGASGGSAGGTPGAPAVHFVGRVDTTDPDAVKFAWSGTGVVARFQGTQVGVRLSGQEYTVVLDGMVRPKLVPGNGTTPIATGLTAGEHTVEIYRRTEAQQGVSTFMGFDFGGGTLLAPPAVSRRLEFVGDSITCGYGNEGPDMNCGFTPQTENHYLAYPALTARALGAEVSTIAWSGKGVVCNYGDDASSCTNPLPTYYERILPDQATPAWDFSKFQPDAVVVNLGTNDLSTTSDPTAMQFEAAYRALLEKIRSKYPNAHILCTNGPMLGGNDLTTVRGYLTNVVTALADPKISTFAIDAQDGSDGYGCDYHPSLARHQKVATVVTAAIKAKLGW
jgi:lysophospholipase L1-like esterase